MQAITVIPMQAGVPVSSPGRRLTIDAAAVNRELVLDDGGIPGTVNANLRHDQAAATGGPLGRWPRPCNGGPPPDCSQPEDGMAVGGDDTPAVQDDPRDRPPVRDRERS